MLKTKTTVQASNIPNRFEYKCIKLLALKYIFYIYSWKKGLEQKPVIVNYK